MPAHAVGDPAVAGSDFDPARSWRLHPQVAVRPEPFGALLYHFGTRKLSFLKNRTILAVIESLTDHLLAPVPVSECGMLRQCYCSAGSPVRTCWDPMVGSSAGLPT